ncbi:hypothetical protein W02_02670 [Nitrospira sp. KM1]|uniref:peroxidase family protein n=1 Tax=Nitrospira sp. KM1 TaxID=1936990 RepID=UPI0013A768D3|nr:peroxidase family protein [Nitrospira sp. KM1]BCA53127.1 hypothetical protein W02_02670 [Nitrospira sp. KM1]
MTDRLYLWDLLRKLVFGLLGVTAAMLFWVLAACFLLLNLLVPWHRLWRHIGIWNLAMHRFIMRKRNLYDTSLLPTRPPRPDPRTWPWNPSYRTARTADGTFNDLQDPLMGSAGTRFARNFPLKRLNDLFKEQVADRSQNLLSPNPRNISRTLLTRDRFRPASSLNLFAAAWIQFQVHDWVNHRRRPPNPAGQTFPPRENTLPPVELDPEDNWSGRSPDQTTMVIRDTLPDDTVDRTSSDFDPGGKFEGLRDFPVYRNSETHWWDGSQLYGSSLDKQMLLREGDESGKLHTVDRSLPPDDTQNGIDLTGFNDNWWAGLNLIHTLFALEHNAICDRLKMAYPHWRGERLFQTARLINTALIAKIHTVEWTPAVLGHPTLYLGMRANWWGILTQRFTKIIGRLRILRDLQEEVTGIPASEQDHHASPFYLTEEFVSVYRMHPLIPDDYRIYDLHTDELKIACRFQDLQGNQTRNFVQQSGVTNLLYSFGVAHPGAVTLNNFPRALQNLRRTREDGYTFPAPGEALDLGTIDIMRDRERAIPRYNNFRRMLMMSPCISYSRLVGVPILKWFSGLTNRQIEERKTWVRQLKRWYPNKEDLDLMVGLHAEELPKGFGFSDTAFRIFVLMAPRRLKSDRFITTDFNADVYTPVGMEWVEHNDFKTVLLRHYPDLAPALDDIKNAFTPWQRTERPSPEPVDPNPAAADPRPDMRRVSIFQMPIFGGAFIGWLVGAGVGAAASPEGFTTGQFLQSLGTGSAAHGTAIGAILGGACLATLYMVSYLATREFTLREQMQTAAGVGAPIGWILGAVVYTLIRGSTFGGVWEVMTTVISALETKAAFLGALLGIVLGYVRAQRPAGVILGASIGWIMGAVAFLWLRQVSFVPLKQDLLPLFEALAEPEALIAAFCGAAVAIIYAGRQSLRTVFSGSGMVKYLSRSAYGFLFGALGGGVIGFIVGVILSLAENFWPFTEVLTMVAGAIAIVAAATVLRDAVVRSKHQLRDGFLLGALAAIIIGGLPLVLIEIVGGFFPIIERGLTVLDIVSFHLVGGVVIGAAAGLILAMSGWVAIAAACGWLFGTVAHLIFNHEIQLFEALLSDQAETGLVLGTLVGFSTTFVLVRDWTWAVIWGLRGTVLGLSAGVILSLLKKASNEGFCSLIWAASTSRSALWGGLIFALFVGSVWMVRTAEVTWGIRGLFWRLFCWVKFIGNRPVPIPPPRRRWWWKQAVRIKFLAEKHAKLARQRGSSLENFLNCVKSRLDACLHRSQAMKALDRIPDVQFSDRFDIPITNIRVSKSVAPDERAGLKEFFSQIQVRLTATFSPMQPDHPLPAISADPFKAIRNAYSFLQRRAFDPPELPPDYEGSPDLGSLAVKGPYACYTERIDDLLYLWDFRALEDYACHKGLYRLGARVGFSHDPVTGRLTPCFIESILGTSKPGDPNWQLAKKLALCTATTHLSLVRHFNWVHLAGSEPLALATRNRLSSDHPICRLLWPHIYGTQQSNYMVTRVQMTQHGDFEEIFSFTYEEMCRLFSQTFSTYTILINDPSLDARARGIAKRGGRQRQVSLNTPTQNNLRQLFAVFLKHCRRYIAAYYPTDARLQEDREIETWLQDMKHLVRNGLELPGDRLTRASLSRLIARLIYMVTVQHEMAGTSLWNYQLWTHRQPVRVYTNGRREPLDVYQRLINANFNLNVSRRSLMDDFSYLALDDRGAVAFTRFRHDLHQLQATMEKDPWEVWKIYPAMLEANINA